LKAAITRENLLAGSQQLEDFAYASAERNRFIGSPGHNDTVYWLKDTLESLDGYYNVSLQQFFTVAQLSGSINSFEVDGAVPLNGSYLLFDYSASGNVTAPLVPVNNLGCNAVGPDQSYYPIHDYMLTFSSRTILRRYLGTSLSFLAEVAILDSSRLWQVLQARLERSSTTM
jgi:hypothetical protein